MATRVIEPASVPTSFRVPGVNTFKVAPSSVGSNIPMGIPLVLSAGKVVECAYDGEVVDDGQLIYALSAEDFKLALAAKDSVPFRQTDIGIVLLTPGCYIEANKYYDGDGDADDTLAAADIGDTVVMRKVNGKLVWDTDTTASSHATFTVVKHVDQIGDVYGRALLVPTASFRFPF